MSSVHTHSKGKRTNLNLSGRKGLFIGYNDTSKAYRIYFPRFKKIDINKDVTFDEDSAYSRSRKLPIEEIEEPESTKVKDTEEATLEDHEDHDMTEPQEPVEPLH